jgi:RND family efflux transporter MFP subunit
MLSRRSRVSMSHKHAHAASRREHATHLETLQLSENEISLSTQASIVSSTRPNWIMPLTSNARCYSNAILAISMMVYIAACGCKEIATPGAVSPTGVAAKQVTVIEARLESWPETIRVQGSLLAYEDAVVGSKLAGRVAEVAVDLGSVVQRGDLLVSLMRDEMDLRVELAEAQLEQACAAVGITPTDDENQFDVHRSPGAMMELALVNEAQSNVNRARPLVSSRAMTEGEFDSLVAQFKAAQARYNAALNTAAEQVSLIGVRRKELALARQTVVDSQITAPFAGVVGERRVSPGEYVQAGQTVVTLVRADRLRFTAGVPESRAAAIQVGQRVEIESDEASPLVTAISRVSPTVMQSSRSILIEADVPNPDLKLQAGIFAEAELVVDPNSQAIVVPTSAVSRFAGVQKVWMVVDGVAKQQTVRTGREDGARIEIVEGLSPGSVLVRSAAEGHDGPVVAVAAAPGATRQANLQDSSSAVREVSSGGAQ